MVCFSLGSQKQGQFFEPKKGCAEVPARAQDDQLGNLQDLDEGTDSSFSTRYIIVTVTVINFVIILT